VAGDKRRIQRVLVNVLNHMIQGTARGGTIRVRFEVANENGSCVECYVENDAPEAGGEPIADPRRSEPGALEDVPEQRPDISLEFCREVIRAHGGTIWAKSHAGRVAGLGFRLPIVRAVHGD
jgi:signal transduction histidine kinase